MNYRLPAKFTLALGLLLSLPLTAAPPPPSNQQAPLSERTVWDRAMGCHEERNATCATAACNELLDTTPWIGEYCLVRTSNPQSRRFSRELDKAFEAYKSTVGSNQLQWHRKAAAADQLKGPDRAQAIIKALDEQVVIAFDASEHLAVVREGQSKIAALTARAEAGDPEAQFELAVAYYEKPLPGVPQDHALAVQWLSRSASQGYHRAEYGMGIAYLQGKGVPEDTRESTAWFERAASKGNLDAQYELALLLSDGKDNPTDDLDRALGLLRSAGKTHAASQTKLGWHYLNGIGVQRDYGQAKQWFERAASQGELYALSNLGYMAENGYAGPKDHGAAARWYERAVAGGLAPAKVSLADLLANGWGVSKDPPRAMALYQEAVAAGEVRGSVGIGRLYEHGIGVPKSVNQAIRHYVDAANKDDVTAMFLASLLLDEQGSMESFKWKRRAAEFGHAAAQNNTGAAYHNGKGVEANTAWALYWYAMAAQQGNTTAVSNIEKLLPERSQLRVIASSARLRSEPRADAGVLTTLAKGVRVFPTDSPSPEWREVFVEDGYRIGYLSKSALEAPAPARPSTPVASNDPWPARPAARPGTTTCATNCRNGDCYRTYADGRRVRFQARQTWNSFNNQLEWDAGGC